MSVHQKGFVRRSFRNDVIVIDDEAESNIAAAVLCVNVATHTGRFVSFCCTHSLRSLRPANHLEAQAVREYSASRKSLRMVHPRFRRS